MRSALENIDKMKVVFLQSRIIFDALSFYLCVLYSHLIIDYDNDDDKCPENFKDPLSSSLMEYPVYLNDKNIVDRITIMRNGFENPYNNIYIKDLDIDLIPQNDLREKITKWKLDKYKLHKIGREKSLQCVLIN